MREHGSRSRRSRTSRCRAGRRPTALVERLGAGRRELEQDHQLGREQDRRRRRCRPRAEGARGGSPSLPRLRGAPRSARSEPPERRRPSSACGLSRAGRRRRCVAGLRTADQHGCEEDEDDAGHELCPETREQRRPSRSRTEQRRLPLSRPFGRSTSRLIATTAMPTGTRSRASPGRPRALPMIRTTARIASGTPSHACALPDGLRRRPRARERSPRGRCSVGADRDRAKVGPLRAGERHRGQERDARRLTRAGVTTR